MFKNAFSFDGRIRRTEYGVAFIIYFICAIIVNLLIASLGDAGVIAFVLLIPVLWFFWAQGAKRCHDRGNSGWFQLIPFYFFVLIFGDSEPGENEYGPNPKGIGNTADEGEISTIGKHLE